MSYTKSIEQYQKERDKWADLSIQRRFWYEDQRIKILDRQVQHTIFLSSISAAIIAVLISLPIHFSAILYWSFWCFLVNVFLGVGLILAGIYIDLKDLKKAKKEELDMYAQFRDAAQEIVEKQTIKSRADYEKLKADIRSKFQVIEKKSFFKRILIPALYCLFLVVFAIGLVLLTWYVLFC